MRNALWLCLSLWVGVTSIARAQIAPEVGPSAPIAPAASAPPAEPSAPIAPAASAPPAEPSAPEAPSVAPSAPVAPSTPSLAQVQATTESRPRRRPGPHEGVMWRLQLGGAYVHGWSDAAGMSRTTSAIPGFAFTVSLGHTVTTSFVLHMDLIGVRSGSATYSSNGETIVEDVDLTAMLMGIGATYWFAPYDVFVTGGLGLGQMSTVSGAFRITITIPDIESTDLGWGFHAGVGKQWRVSRRWGIGPVFQFWFMRAGQDVATPLNLIAVTLSLSATYD